MTRPRAPVVARIHRAALAGLFVSCSAAFAESPDVHIDVSGVQGKGFAVVRGADCFVLTAAHVVGEPQPVRVIGARRRQVAASVLWSNARWDLAVLKVEEPAEVCDLEQHPYSGDVTATLQGGGNGRLRNRAEDGTMRDIPLAVSEWDEDYVFVRPLDPGTILQEGLSGSMIYVDENRVGILVAVRVEGANRGKVLRIDRIHDEIRDFLPLKRPTDEEARYDDQLALDILDANHSLMESPAFCESLYASARWLVQQTPRLRYLERRQTDPGQYAYVIPNVLISGTDSVLSTRPVRDGRRLLFFRSLVTSIGRVPGTEEVLPHWRRAQQAVHRCVSRKALRGVSRLGYRSGPPEGATLGDPRVSWDLDYTGRWGMVLEIITITLRHTVGEIELDIWISVRNPGDEGVTSE